MGSLRDEVYENLDYLSQLTEVVVGPQNEVLAQIPDRIELSLQTVNELRRGSWGSAHGFEISKDSVLMRYVPNNQWCYLRDILSHFEFEISNDFEFDLVNQSMTGTLALVKKVFQLDEKKLLELAVENACNLLQRYDWPAKRLKEKTITVLNTFEPGKGTEWAKNLESGRVAWQAIQAIDDTIRDSILENKWRVRDAKVIAKIGEWINSYMKDETDSSVGLVNLIKLKIMLDKDLPVYSIEEVKKNGVTIGTT